MLAELGVEPLERFEEVPLLRVVQRLAEIPVARGRLASSAGGAAAPPPREPNHQRDEQAIERAWGTSFERSWRGFRRSPLAELDRLGAVQRNTEQLRLDALVERERLRAVEVVAARRLAVDRDLDLVATRRQVARVDALHAAVLQRVELLEAVEVVRRELRRRC